MTPGPVTSPLPRVTVAGAGVVGLTCAVRLAEGGYPVDILARDLPLETTSAVAGGHWGAFLSHPDERVGRWARRTFEELRAISAVPGSGVFMKRGFFIGSHRPDWADAAPDLAPLVPVMKAPGGRGGWEQTAPMSNMPVYLTYLMQRLRSAGGTITRLPLPALPARGLVINCTGLAARSLAHDHTVKPIRGQLLVLANPGLTDWIVDTDNDPAAPTYVFPYPGRVVVGGTVEAGEWSTDPEPETIDAIRRRAEAIVPELAGAAVLGIRTGLRPSRPAVRLETVTSATSTVVHCYGHGGAGVTLAWGCADDVLAEVQRVTSAVGVA